MKSENLHIFKKPSFNAPPKVLLGFEGWMDGGDVSTGTVNYFISKLKATEFASIEPDGFYLYSFPGDMKIASLFRPTVIIEDGIIEYYSPPKNSFYYSEKHNIILFFGKEPNLQWDDFANSIFSLCSKFNAKTVYFIGSLVSLVPHTREPRIIYSASDIELKESLQHYGLKPANYEGPSSFITYMTVLAQKHNLHMANLIATIPAYVEGSNPMCLAAIVKRLTGILGIEIDTKDLDTMSAKFEEKIDDIILEHPELAKNIDKLEEDYDNEIFDSEMTELKHWLQQKGIRVD